jgi:hypothetical protein
MTCTPKCRDFEPKYSLCCWPEESFGQTSLSTVLLGFFLLCDLYSLARGRIPCVMLFVHIKLSFPRIGKPSIFVYLLSSVREPSRVC